MTSPTPPRFLHCVHPASKEIGALRPPWLPAMGPLRRPIPRDHAPFPPATSPGRLTWNAGARPPRAVTLSKRHAGTPFELPTLFAVRDRRRPCMTTPTEE